MVGEATLSACSARRSVLLGNDRTVWTVRTRPAFPRVSPCRPSERNTFSSGPVWTRAGSGFRQSLEKLRAPAGVIPLDPPPLAHSAGHRGVDLHRTGTPPDIFPGRPACTLAVVYPPRQRSWAGDLQLAVRGKACARSVPTARRSAGGGRRGMGMLDVGAVKIRAAHRRQASRRRSRH